MPKRTVADTDKIVEAYKRLGSKQKVRKELGLSWGTVAKHLNQFANICPRCWRPNDSPGKRFCSLCRKSIAKARAEKRDERRKIGLCICCNNPIEPPSVAFCSRHRQMANDAGKRWRLNNPKLNRIYHLKRKHRSGDGSVNSHTIYTRDGFACVICGSGLRLEVHHIDRNHSNNILENMDTLCFHCHRAITFILNSPNIPSLLKYFSNRYPFG